MTFRELKAKKAKFGFDCGQISLCSIITLGEFMTKLKFRFDPAKFTTELSSHGSRNELRVYTNDKDVAHWIRNYHP